MFEELLEKYNNFTITADELVTLRDLVEERIHIVKPPNTDMRKHIGDYYTSLIIRGLHELLFDVESKLIRLGKL